MKNKKGRVFSLIIYNRRRIDEVLIEKAELIKNYALILHDKDKDDNGNAKKNHYHMLIKTLNPYTASSVNKWFDDDEGANSLCELCNTPKRAFEYLIHKNNPEKFQYNIDEIEGNWIFESSNTDPLTDAFFDYANGMKLKDLISKYGRDFIIHYNQIKMIYLDYKQEEEFKND